MGTPVGPASGTQGSAQLDYVNTVTHNLKRGEYKQNFSLSRDGQISNTQLVMP